MNTQSQYSDAVHLSLQRIYGKGYMSPGGDDEVRRVVHGIDLSSARVLDLGCGLGGATRVLAGDLNAAHVIAVDIDRGNLEETRRAVAGTPFEDRVSLKLSEPGPLPLEDGSIDVVFCTAVACHIEDKAGFFADVLRVLKPGGFFTGADWMRSTDNQPSEDYLAFERDMRDAGLIFYFVSVAAHTNAFEAAGFEPASFADESARIRGEALQTLEEIEGPARDELTAAMGEPGYQGFLTRCRARIDTLGSGELTYQIFRARV